MRQRSAKRGLGKTWPARIEMTALWTLSGPLAVHEKLAEGVAVVVADSCQKMPVVPVM